MVQPINYADLAGGFQSPEQAFTNTIKLREYYLQQQKAAEDARLAKELKIKMDADLKDYTSAPTPQKLANLYLNHPSLKTGLDAYTSTLSDQDKKTTTEFATKALSFNSANKSDEVLSLFDEYAKAATESNRPDMAKVFADAKTTYGKIEDPKAREALIGSVLASTGKEGLDIYDKLYKNLYGEPENLSAVGKEYQDRVRIQGKEEADKWLNLQGEKLVAVEPGGAVYKGSDILGTGPITGKAAPPGVTFTPLKQGGQTETSSGNFR